MWKNRFLGIDYDNWKRGDSCQAFDWPRSALQYWISTECQAGERMNLHCQKLFRISSRYDWYNINRLLAVQNKEIEKERKRDRKEESSRPTVISLTILSAFIPSYLSASRTFVDINKLLGLWNLTVLWGDKEFDNAYIKISAERLQSNHTDICSGKTSCSSRCGAGWTATSNNWTLRLLSSIDGSTCYCFPVQCGRL